MSLKQPLSWQIYNQLILLNNLYQIRANSVSRSIPVHGPEYMVLETDTLSILRNCRRYMFSMLICLLAKKYTLLRVKMKKHQSGINTWYQLIPQDTLLRCVLFLVSSPSKSNSKSEGKFFLLLIAKFAYNIKQIWPNFLSFGWDGIQTQQFLVHNKYSPIMSYMYNYLLFINFYFFRNH